jgi:protein associated with RNAse G/E
MKKMKKLLFVAIASMALFSACKKKDVEPEVVPVVVAKTVAQKIIAKWKVTSVVENDYYSNMSHPFTYTGVATDYFDVRTDGKIYLQISLVGKDTLAYSLINDSTINIGGDITKIKTITDTKFEMYFKEVYSTNPLEYYEFTTNLSK